jgi:hypothetical protein
MFCNHNIQVGTRYTNGGKDLECSRCQFHPVFALLGA